MSVGVKVAGFAVLGRLLFYAFGDLASSWSWVLSILAVLSMTVGNLAALRQTNLKRMLAYSSIAHAGYILVGLASGTPMGVRAVLFYLCVYVFMNAAAFAVIIAASRLGGSTGGGARLEDFAGLGARLPWLAALMALLMFSLSGVPPLAGFFAKLWVFSAAVEADLIWLAVIGVANSVVSAYYYLRVVAAMYFQRREPSEEDNVYVSRALGIGLGLAVAAVVVLSIWPAPILDLTRAMVEALVGG
jgi:NADH-quinone oxidoreductase subunit N